MMWLTPLCASLQNETGLMPALGGFQGFPGGFRGQRIIAATLKSAQKWLGFGATQSTRVLFGGCTPGSIYNLDTVTNIIRGLGIKPGACQRPVSSFQGATIAALRCAAASHAWRA